MPVSRVIGNWKLHGDRAMSETLIGGLRQVQDLACEVSVCPPHVLLPWCVELARDSSVRIGAQDCSPHASGAHTGEVAAAMLREVGCGMVIVGHSERRMDHHENDALVASKAQAALDAGLTPVVCVGETLEQRDAEQTEQVVLSQLKAVSDLLAARMGEIVLAYEPVWAIGTGRTATPQQAQAVHAALRQALKGMKAADVSILYGGSVKPDNAASLFDQPDIDGGLIGGASLKLDDFLTICRAAR